EVLKHKIIRVTPTGQLTEFAVEGPSVGVLRGIAPGSDGKLYVTSREENAIRRLGLDGKFDGTFEIPSRAAVANSMTPGAWPRGITASPEGAVWFAEMTGNRIGRITPDGKITELPVPTAAPSHMALWRGGIRRSGSPKAAQ